MSETKKKSVRATGKTGLPPGAGYCVYIGPTVPSVIQSGTVIPGDPEKARAAYASAVEREPLIATLIVSGQTLAADRIKVKTPGNLLYVNYRKLSGKL